MSESGTQSRLMTHDKLRVQVWDREFMLHARSFSLAPSRQPYRRLSATLLVAGHKPFKLATGDQSASSYQGALIAPNVIRNTLEAEDSELLIMDVGITSPAFAAFAPLIQRGGTRSLTSSELARLQPLAREIITTRLDCACAGRFFRRLVAALAGPGPHRLERDPRVERALDYLDNTPLAELDFNHLVDVANVSRSYLRSLFRKHLYCTASEYAAWMAAWRIVKLWAEGAQFTDIALEAGFHDLSHLDHTVRRFFGITPTFIVDKTNVELHRCQGVAPWE